MGKTSDRESTTDATASGDGRHGARAETGAREALAASERRLRLLFENMADVVVEGSNEGVVTWVSPSVTEVLGWEPEEFVGRYFTEFVHPDELDHIMSTRARVSAGEVSRYETRTRHKDGAYRWMDVVMRPVVDEAGRVVSRVGGMRDVTLQHDTAEALAESEDLFRWMFEHSLEGKALVGPDGHVQRVNTAFCEILGYACGEVEGRLARELLAEDDGRAPSALLASLLSGEVETARARWRARAGDGSLRWLDVTIAARAGSDGGLLYILVSFVDVSGQVMAAEEMARLEALRDRAEEIGRTGSYEVDIETLRTTWSPGLCRLFDVDPEAFDGDLARVLDTIVHPDDRDRVVTDLAKLREMGASWPQELRVVRRDGSVHVLAGPSALEPGEDGRLTRLVGTFEDVTELRAVEAAASRLEAIRVAAEQAGMGSASLDPWTMHLTFTPGASALFGLPREVHEGDVAEFLSLAHPDDLELVLQAWEDARLTGEPRPYENRVRWPDGSEHVVRVTGVVERDAHGEITALTGWLQDVTVQRRIEAELRALSERLEARVAERTAQLEAANRELEAFAYSAAHDLRAPLRAIDGFSELVATGAADRLDETERADLRRVRAAAQRMAQLIDHLMAISRASRHEPAVEQVDVTSLALEVCAEVCGPEPARDLELVVAPGLTATTDAGVLRAVLTGLVENAWKFTAHHPNARIEIGAMPVDGETAFFVSDDGAGFDPAGAAHLFAPFQHYHTPEQFPGDGVGLATVRRLVASIGGRVWAEAQVEMGATFFFTLGDPTDDGGEHG